MLTELTTRIEYLQLLKEQLLEEKVLKKVYISEEQLKLLQEYKEYERNIMKVVLNEFQEDNEDNLEKYNYLLTLIEETPETTSLHELFSIIYELLFKTEVNAVVASIYGELRAMNAQGENDYLTTNAYQKYEIAENLVYKIESFGLNVWKQFKTDYDTKINKGGKTYRTVEDFRRNLINDYKKFLWNFKRKLQHAAMVWMEENKAKLKNERFDYVGFLLKPRIHLNEASHQLYLKFGVFDEFQGPDNDLFLETVNKIYSGVDINNNGVVINEDGSWSLKKSKKVYVSENQITLLKEALDNGMKTGLPRIVVQQVLAGRTSLGDNPCFPPEMDEKIEIKLLSKTYERVLSEVNTLYPETEISVDNAKTTLSKILTEIYNKEKALKEQLEKVVLNNIKNIFDISSEEVDFNVNLIDRITKDDIKTPLQPESSDEVEFDSIEDIHGLNADVYKRRVVNCMMYGIASHYLSKGEWINGIYEINPDLIPLYRKAMALNDYINFNTDANLINDNDITQASTSNVVVKSDRSVVDVKAVNFISLLHESIRATLDLISFHGLPTDNVRAIRKILKSADFLLANKWDERFGRAMWQSLNVADEQQKLIPYLFFEIITKPAEEFNALLQNVFAGTKQGRTDLQSLLDGIQYKMDRDQLEKEIEGKKQLITDDVL